MIIFIRKFTPKLDTVYVRNRAGCIYNGARLDSFSALNFNVVFISRRLVIAILIVYLYWFPALQAQCIIITSLIVFIYSYSTAPFVDKRMNKLDFVNETCILILSYMTIPYSDYLSDPYLKFKMGWFSIAIFLFNFLFNFFFIIVTVLIKIKIKICLKLKERQKNTTKK